MRTSALLALLPVIAAVPGHIVARQGPGDCIAACVAQQQANPGPCAADDVTCLCADQQVQWNFAGCIQYTCDPSQVEAGLAFGQQICSGAAAASSAGTPAGIPIVSSVAASASSAIAGASAAVSGADASVTSAAASASSAAASAASAASSAIASGASAVESEAASITSAAASGAGAAASSASSAASVAQSGIQSANSAASSAASSAGGVIASAASSASAAASSLRSQTSALAAPSSSAWAMPTAAPGVLGMMVLAAGAVVAI